MSRRRVIGVVVALIAVLAVVLWHRTRSTEAPTTTTAAQHKTSHASTGGLASSADPAATKHVAGTVFLDATPAGGASVHLLDNRGIGTERAVQTDAAGHFDFGAVVVGRYFVVAELAHATGAALSIDLRNPVPVPAADQLRLVAHACEAVLHGVVRDASGGTIAKAHIIQSDRGIAGPGVDSNDDGSYELCVDVGSSSIVVRADGYADVSTEITAFGKIRRDFDLVPEAVVAGRAVRADNGAPVENAHVMLIPDRPGFNGLSIFSATSDSDGRFRFHGVARGSYSMNATASHLVTTDPVTVTADVSAPTEDLQVVLAAALSVSGRVVDKKKNPIAGASVSLQSAGSFNFALMDNYVVTETDGSFFIDHLTPGDYRVRVSRYALAKAARQLKLDKKDLTDVVLEVDPLGSIAGRVTRAGKPVEGADVSAQPVDPKQPRDFENFGNMSTKSDAEGKFTLRGLPADTYHVYAQSERVGAFTQGPEVKLGDAEAKTGVEVEMELAGSIAGVVVDQNDAPVAGVFLRFSLLHGEDGGQATTGEDGTFKASALSGGGEYLYEVRPASSSPIELHPVEGKRFPPIAVKDGNTQVTGVRIKVQYERLAISGRVLTSNGEPAADVTVSAQQEPERGWASPMATTDTSGRFTIRDLPSGTYTVRAQAASAVQRVKGIAAGTKGVELRLPGLGTIEGTLVGFTKPPTVLAFLMNDDDMMMGGGLQRATITGNRFTFANVPVGPYSIAARSDDGSARGQVTVAVGAKATVTLTNKGVGTVEGRVLDEKGAALADVRCNGGNGRSTTTDSDGNFKLDHVEAGEAQVFCMTPDARGSATTTLEPGATVHVDVVLKSGSNVFTRSYSGLQFESRMSEVVVAKVETGSPGEKAGIKTGDVLQKIGERAVDGRWGGETAQRMIESRPPGTDVKLTIEREDKEQTVEIKLDAPRASSE